MFQLYHIAPHYTFINNLLQRGRSILLTITYMYDNSL